MNRNRNNIIHPEGHRRLVNEDDHDLWIKQVERAAARKRRQFGGKVRRVLQNDPTMVEISENFQCALTAGDILPPLFRALMKNSHLVTLELHSCPLEYMTGGFAHVLCHNSTLQSLTLRDCHIQSMGAAALFKALTINKTLKRLNLSNNTRLFQLPNHQHQHHHHHHHHPTTLVGSQGETRDPPSHCCPATLALQKLEHFQGLRRMNLSNTGLSPDAIRCILKGLERNDTLQSLDVSQNSAIAPTLVDALCDSLPHMKGLEILNVQHTHLSACFDQQPVRMRQFIQAMERNTKLWKFDSIVLHHVSYYNHPKQQQIQQQCWDEIRSFEYYKVRNGFLAGGWLTMDQQSLWPFVLSKLGGGGGGGHAGNHDANASSANPSWSSQSPPSSSSPSSPPTSTMMVVKEGQFPKLDILYWLVQEKICELLLPRPHHLPAVAKPLSSSLSSSSQSGSITTPTTIKTIKTITSVQPFQPSLESTPTPTRKRNGSMDAINSTPTSSSSSKRQRRGSPSSTKQQQQQQQQKRGNNSHVVPTRSTKTSTWTTITTTDNTSPGFSCRIHGGGVVCLIPRDCCTFETMQPLRTNRPVISLESSRPQRR